MTKKVTIGKKTTHECAYCQLPCDKEIWQDQKVFCCHGCLTLDQTGGNFKELLEKADDHVKYQQYDLVELFNKLTDYQDKNKYTITLKLPEIHCSSCVRILEDLPQLVEDVELCRVNFETKKLFIRANKKLPLSKLFYLLDSIGYPPQIDLEQKEKKSKKKRQQQELIKLAIAGFVFGNIMLFSLPHYFGLSIASDAFFSNVFKTLNVILSLGTLYAGSAYLTSASKAIKIGKSHIDIPIALGIIALWGWSMYEIVAQVGFGYMDSLAALIFFLLIGKWLQSKVYEKVSFERSLSEFMPLVVRKKAGKFFSWVKVKDLIPGDTISIKNGETIPINGTLLSTNTHVDYSFVTGESKIHEVTRGGRIFVGAKLVGLKAEVAITELADVNKLWSSWKSPKTKNDTTPVWTITVGKYFTAAILFLAILGTVSWLFIDASKALFVGVAVLIIACPCALALSLPFTYGGVWNVLTKNGFYLKSPEMVGLLSNVKHILFDKTGTLTTQEGNKAIYSGSKLDENEKKIIYSTSQNSNHPLAKSIVAYYANVTDVDLDTFDEIVGKGMTASYRGMTIRMGSAKFLNLANNGQGSTVHLEINGKYKGCFVLKSNYRSGLNNLLSRLKNSYKVSVLSGDNVQEVQGLRKVFDQFNFMGFGKNPEEKKAHIEGLSRNLESSMMVGDGLNDQIAIKQSDIGIIVTESISGFYPSADGVLLSESFNKLSSIMDLSRFAKIVLKICLGFSLMYNIIGLSYALSGTLTPLIAAILMPISSISVVILSTFLIRLKAKRLKLI